MANSFWERVLHGGSPRGLDRIPWAMSKPTHLILGVANLVIVAVMLLLIVVAMVWPAMTKTAPFVLKVGPGALFIVNAATGAVIRRRDRARFRRRLLDEQYECCTECGYSLRGLPDESKCPECGTSYRKVDVHQVWQSWDTGGRSAGAATRRNYDSVDGG